jgi:hypothetical protein
MQPQLTVIGTNDQMSTAVATRRLTSWLPRARHLAEGGPGDPPLHALQSWHAATQDLSVRLVQPLKACTAPTQHVRAC